MTVDHDRLSDSCPRRRVSPGGFLSALGTQPPLGPRTCQFKYGLNIRAFLLLIMAMAQMASTGARRAKPPSPLYPHLCKMMRKPLGRTRMTRTQHTAIAIVLVACSLPLLTRDHQRQCVTGGTLLTFKQLHGMIRRSGRRRGILSRRKFHRSETPPPQFS